LTFPVQNTLIVLGQRKYNIKNDSTEAVPPKVHGDHKSDNQVLEEKIFGVMICQTPEVTNSMKYFFEKINKCAT
jgi:hypothetical protein